MPSPNYSDFIVRPNIGGLRLPSEDWQYNFGTVLPSVELLPLEDLAETARKAVLEDGHYLAYYPPDQGPKDAREFIATLLKKDRGIPVEADELLLTNGSLEAIRLVMYNLINPGDVIVAEQHHYQGSLRIFRQFQAEVIGVETDVDGMVTERLAETLEGLRRQNKRPKFIYTIPTFQNPEGTVLSAERRREVLRLAQEYGTLVFEDDCYVHERIDGQEVPPAIASLPGARDWVIYCATFSKVLGPGIRLGWLTAPEPVLLSMVNWKLSGGNNYLTTSIVIRYLSEHWDQRMAALNGALRTRRDAMVGALGEHFGDLATFRVPAGGMYLWVGFPEGVDTAAFLEKAQAAGIRYVPGVQFSPANGAGNYCRLAFAFENEKTIQEGIGLLARLMYKEGILPLT